MRIRWHANGDGASSAFSELLNSDMKKIIFYSPDFTLNLSFLMYLQPLYNITTTTDIDDLKAICSSFSCDLILLDAPPSSDMELLCRDLKLLKSETPIVLLYVFDKKFKTFEENIRKYVSSVFYKPFDLDNVTQQLSMLTG